MNEAKQATPHKELIEQLMDSRIPKTEREHAARREIEMLREAVLAEREACAKVCEDMDHNGVMIAADCAAAIRERGNT